MLSGLAVAAIDDTGTMMCGGINDAKLEIVALAEDSASSETLDTDRVTCGEPW
jgi:hypothetical protein